MRRYLIVLVFLMIQSQAFCWGFFGHRKINSMAVFLLPPEMMRFYKPHIEYLETHAVDPDKRRYAVAAEGPRHYIDMDQYGSYPYNNLPKKWNEAVARFGEDSLQQHGIVPWHIQVMLKRLTRAFQQKEAAQILQLSAEIGHYIADAHVPLHASSNHNGQKTNQKGIHGFWESRVPELLADTTFDFFIGKAQYISNPLQFTWDRVYESARAADTVLKTEYQLTQKFRGDRKYVFELHGNLTTRQYSPEFTRAFNYRLNGMVERRMRQAIFAVASFWYTAWVNAGQPDVSALQLLPPTEAEQAAMNRLNEAWRSGAKMMGREE